MALEGIDRLQEHSQVLRARIKRNWALTEGFQRECSYHEGERYGKIKGLITGFFIGLICTPLTAAVMLSLLDK